MLLPLSLGDQGYSPVTAARDEQILLELGKHVIILLVRPQQV